MMNIRIMGLVALESSGVDIEKAKLRPVGAEIWCLMLAL